MAQTCRAQVNKYIALHNSNESLLLRPSNKTGTAFSLLANGGRAAYFMACGVVDLLTLFNWGCWNAPNAMQLSTLIAEYQFAMLEELYNKTNARDFLLVNVFPVDMGMDGSNPTAKNTMKTLVDTTNALFANKTAAFVKARPDAAFEIIDWNGAMMALYNDPKSATARKYFGPTGVEMYGSCLDGSTDTMDVKVCSDPDRRFKWDGHFSRVGHRYLGDFGVPYFERIVGRRVNETEEAQKAAEAAKSSQTGAVAAPTASATAQGIAAASVTPAAAQKTPAAQLGGAVAGIQVRLASTILALVAVLGLYF